MRHILISLHQFYLHISSILLRSWKVLLYRQKFGEIGSTSLHTWTESTDLFSSKYSDTVVALGHQLFVEHVIDMCLGLWRLWRNKMSKIDHPAPTTISISVYPLFKTILCLPFSLRIKSKFLRLFSIWPHHPFPILSLHLYLLHVFILLFNPIVSESDRFSNHAPCVFWLPCLLHVCIRLHMLLLLILCFHPQ